MGLDMYLALEGEAPFESLVEATREAGLLQHWYDGTPKALGDYDDGREIENAFPVLAYWRKANAIHGWFVRELAAGVDECQKIRVKREQLVDLVGRCARVLAASDRAGAAEAEGLTPTSGFFFGGNDYDDWYEQELQDTVKQLTAVLEAEPLKPLSFFYRASW